MNETIKAIEKISKELENSMAIQNKILDDNILEAKKQCTTEQFAFIQESIDNARKGELDLSQFIKAIKEYPSFL